MVALASGRDRHPLESVVNELTRELGDIEIDLDRTQGRAFVDALLDDSANRRLAISESFLTADAILELLLNLTSGLVVRKAVIARHVSEELPFIASEEVLMEATKSGGDRQELHELIRVAAGEASERLKTEGGDNDFLDRLEKLDGLADAVRTVRGRLDPARFTGRAAAQVTAFLEGEVDPLLAGHPPEELEDEIRV